MTITTLHAGTRPLCLVLDVSPDLWFSNIKDDIDQAKQVCQQCPLQQPCLQGAIDRGETAGIWGSYNFGRKLHGWRQCDQCRNRFMATRPFSKYCSRLCKGRASDQRRKAAAA